MKQIMKKINSNSAKDDNAKFSEDNSLKSSNTQFVSNYDSHSEEKPHQTETVNSTNNPDRSSGLNIDITDDTDSIKIKIDKNCSNNLDVKLNNGVLKKKK